LHHDVLNAEPSKAPHLILYRNLLKDILGLQRVDDQTEILNGNEEQRAVIKGEVCYLEGVEAADLGREVLKVCHIVG
jgi:hypothetical protein